MKKTRKLIDLVSVGPATIEDFNLLGIKKVSDLIDKKAEKLYAQLQQRRGEKMDICCQDVFRAAIEQARDPDLAPEKCQWWYWSRKRKAGEGGAVLLGASNLELDLLLIQGSSWLQMES